MDYQVFLVSRMREEFKHGATPKDAIRDGFRHGARVVTAAALIMIAVFSGFIVPDDPIIKSVGFAPNVDIEGAALERAGRPLPPRAAGQPLSQS